MNEEQGIDYKTLAFKSSTKVWWICSQNNEHRWLSPVVYRTYSKTGCPFCIIYRNESEFRKLFSLNTNFVFINDRIKGLRKLFKNNLIQIDMINKDNKVIIEYDGWYGHGENQYHKRTEAEGEARDIDTTLTLLSEGYKVIRIRETPLKYLPITNINFFQLSFKDRSNKMPLIEKCVTELQKMGCNINMV